MEKCAVPSAIVGPVERHLEPLVACVSGIVQLRVPLNLPGVTSVVYAMQPIKPQTATPPAQQPAATSHPTQQDPLPLVKPPAAELTAEQLRAKAYVLTGQQNLKSLDYLSAENNFQMALNLDPENSAAKQGLATAKKLLGD